MTKTVSRAKKIITQVRRVSPAKSTTAQAIDEQSLWEPTAQDLVDGGSTEFDDDLVRLIEDCMLHGACYQVPN